MAIQKTHNYNTPHNTAQHITTQRNTHTHTHTHTSHTTHHTPHTTTQHNKRSSRSPFALHACHDASPICPSPADVANEAPSRRRGNHANRCRRRAAAAPVLASSSTTQYTGAHTQYRCLPRHPPHSVPFGARHVFHHIVHRCSPHHPSSTILHIVYLRCSQHHPPHTVRARHVIHHIVYQCPQVAMSSTTCVPVLPRYPPLRTRVTFASTPLDYRGKRVAWASAIAYVGVVVLRYVVVLCVCV